MTEPEDPGRELHASLAALHEASFGWALSCCDWNEDEAKDVVQTTYLKIVSGQARFGGRSTLRTWLFGVIYRTAMEHTRRERALQARAERWGRERRSDGTWENREEDGILREESSRKLVAALSELPVRQREVLHLVFYQDLTIREAAEIMGVSLGTARVHYERGKERLRSLLRDDRG